MIKSIGILGTALIVGSPLLTAAVFAAEQDSRDRAASAVVRPINQSGIKGAIFFSDSGNADEGISFTGFARNLDPKLTYVSLVYDDGSVAKGPSACLPSDASLSFTKMVLGVWKVYANGFGVLQGSHTGDAYAALGDIGTTSIRQDTQPGTPLPSAPDPARFQLQACGNVR